MRVTLTPTQADVVRRALLLYSRLHMGRFDELVRLFPSSWADRARVSTAAQVLKALLFGLDEHQSLGALDDRVPENARIARDLAVALGAALMDSRETPVALSYEPLPRIEPGDNDEHEQG